MEKERQSFRCKKCNAITIYDGDFVVKEGCDCGWIYLEEVKRVKVKEIKGE